MPSSRYDSLTTRFESAAFTISDATRSEDGTSVQLLRFHAVGDERESLKLLFRVLQKLDREDLERVLEVEDVADQPLQVAVAPPVGAHLSDVLKEGPLTVEEFESVATGLNATAAVHDLGLIHGAIRPELLWLDRSDPKDWKVRLHGFGLGFGDGGDGSKATVSAYRCAAPEQWEGSGARRRSDVWAMGCVLYEALSGRAAFDAKTLKELRLKHLNHDVLDLAKLAPQVPKWVTACVMRLMSADLEERPRKAGVALEIFSKGDQEVANPTPNAPPPAAGTATGSTPAVGGTSGVVPVPAAAQVMAPWTQSVKVQAPPPPRQPITATRMVATAGAVRKPATASPLPPAARAPVLPPKNPAPWKWIGIAGGAVAAMLVVWLVLGSGDEKPAPAKPAPSKDVATPKAPNNNSAKAPAIAAKEETPPAMPSDPVIVPVEPHPRNASLQWISPDRFQPGMAPHKPADSPAPILPVDLFLHLRADTGVFGYGLGQGVLLPMAGNKPVADWWDLSDLGGVNTLSTFPWRLEQKRIQRRVIEPGPAFPLKQPRSFITFEDVPGPPVTLALTAKGLPPDRPYSPPHRALTLAVVFFAGAQPSAQIISSIPGRDARLDFVAGLGEDGKGTVLMRSQDTRKNKPADRKMVQQETEGTLDLRVPTLLIATWMPPPQKSELRVVNALGQSSRSPGMEMPEPHGAVADITFGSMPQGQWNNNNNPQANFRGGFAEILVYRTGLTEPQMQTLESQLTEYYFPRN